MMLFFRSDQEMIDRAARIAASDIRANFMPYQAGLLEEEKVCIMAGIDYDTPWTRDTAINTCFALAVTDPEIARNTLLSVCERNEDGTRIHIAGQYWDKIIWILGARKYLQVNRDQEFLFIAAEAAWDTLREMEAHEQDPEDGLFRGPAVYGDGVAAYPQRYAKTAWNSSGILEWPDANPQLRAKTGYGIPMKTLSTNIIYCEAYHAAAWLLRKREEIEDRDLFHLVVLLENRAKGLKKRINEQFWNDVTGRYDYLFDAQGRCESSEALGLAFSILYGIADEEKAESIVRNTLVLPEGIPVVWPAFQRYCIQEKSGEKIGEEIGEEISFRHYGRHSGTIWPHAQAYWALAMKKIGQNEAFSHELYAMARHAVRDMQFAEIYHPETGEIYGGLQEPGENGGPGLHLWKSCEKQTWSATGFWALLLHGIFGITYEEERIVLTPSLPEGMQIARLDGLPAGGRCVTVVLRGTPDPDRAQQDLTIPLGKEGPVYYEFKAG